MDNLREARFYARPEVLLPVAMPPGHRYRSKRTVHKLSTYGKTSRSIEKLLHRISLSPFIDTVFRWHVAVDLRSELDAHQRKSSETH